MKEVRAFLIDDGERTALFVPYWGLIMEVSRKEKFLVSSIMNQPHFSPDDLFEIFPEIDRNRLLSRDIERPTSSRTSDAFCPDSAVLFTTLDCNLCCIYCYAKGGEKKESMSQQIAKATVDFIIENARFGGSGKCSLEFHGGGEPTLNWPVFTFTLDYFQKAAQRNGLATEITIATNGMLSDYRIDWIASHMQEVQVSFDGPEEIQNFQRPTSAGGKSFKTVYHTVESLLAKGVKVTIHSVVTELGVTRIPEIVHFFVANFPGTTIHLEPACQCGRGLTCGQQFPSAEMFVKGFIEAQKLAKPSGTELFYSGVNPRLTEFHENFCGVTAPNFVVTPTGLVTACHEVAEPEHPLAQYFIYGHLDYEKETFLFDHWKINNLKNLIATIPSECSDCFAHFQCASDCLTKSLSNLGERGVSSLNPRCKINQEMMRRYIFHELLNKKGESS